MQSYSEALRQLVQDVHDSRVVLRVYAWLAFVVGLAITGSRIRGLEGMPAGVLVVDLDRRPRSSPPAQRCMGYRSTMNRSNAAARCAGLPLATFLPV